MSQYYTYKPQYSIMPLSVCTPDYTVLCQYFQRYYLDKAMSTLKWDLPDGWDYDYFRYTLYIKGFIAGLYTDTYGIICQDCGLLDNNLYNLPKSIFIGNQFVQVNHRDIGDRCQLFYLNGDLRSAMESIDIYASASASAMLTLLTNMQNSKLSYVFSCSDKKEAESMKKMFDMVMSGELAVFPKQNLTGKWELFVQNVGQNYIADRILSDLKKIENRFNTEWGIPNTNVEKRERMSTNEVESNNGETRSKIWIILDRLKRQVKEFNDMFGAELMSVELNREVMVDENQLHDDTIGSVSNGQQRTV